MLCLSSLIKYDELLVTVNDRCMLSKQHSMFF
jgi:hypothetical protein